MRRRRPRKLHPFRGSGRRISRRTQSSLALVFAVVFAPGAASRVDAACVPMSVPQLIDTSASPFAVTADIDGDGDLDLVSAANTPFNRVGWHENDGSAGGWTLHTIASPTSPRQVAAGDLDGDGDVDVVSVATTFDEVAWQENLSGDGTSWSTHTITTAAEFPDVTILADLDGDGDLDVVVAAQSSTFLGWFGNDGSGGGWTPHVVTTNLATAAAIVAADLDRDGDLDLLVSADSDQAVLWFENQGGSWTGHAIATGLGSPASVVAADLDRDGDPDVAYALQADNRVIWRENDGTAGGWTVHTVALGLIAATGLAAADPDGDGDLDLYYTSVSHDEVGWFENDGAGGAWTLHTLSTSLDGTGRVATADLDGDGDVDAIANASLTDDRLVWFDNQRLHGEALFASPQTIGSTGPGAYDAFAADLDGDGDLDLLSATRNDDKMAWYENLAPGDGSSWSLHTISTSALAAYGVFAADVDGDGDLDALSASRDDDKIAWYENLAPGNGSAWSLHTISTSALGAQAVSAADVDGDGDFDALSASKDDDKIAWYENLGPGNGSSWALHTISTTADFARAVLAADVNGDGELDVLSVSVNDGKLAWYENDGTPASGAWTLRTISTATGGGRGVFAADVDRDGDVDVLSGYLDGSYALVWHENLAPADGSAWSMHTIVTLGSPAKSIAAADIDGDGDVDTMVATFSSLQWQENDGSPADGGWVAHEIDSPVAYQWTILAADIDGDGSLDALASEYGSTRILWYENRGTKVFACGFDSEPDPLDANLGCWSTKVP